MGYASGTGLLHAIGLGYIAGRAAVAELSLHDRPNANSP